MARLEERSQRLNRLRAELDQTQSEILEQRLEEEILRSGTADRDIGFDGLGALRHLARPGLLQRERDRAGGDAEEAAALDGYGPVRHFLRITVPLISPALMFLAVVLVVAALQAYAQIEVLTNGGPGTSTQTLLFKIADPQGIRPLGIRASMSIGLFALTAIVAAGQYALLSKRVHYGD